MSEPTPVIETHDLIVDYGRGAKRNRAVEGISFSIAPGECVGFIGANGAGKSTTMKTIMGFIFPTSGSVRVFGAAAGTVESRRRIGYLPEVALYYPFMKARELLELYGGLQGMRRAELRTRIPGLLEEVGLAGKGESLLRNFSKGMQQRLGIAQAIIAQPEALIFDELSSGLDPIGRHDLREVLLRLKREGRTIFFSSHELSEVESLCDRVIMIDKGRIVTQATVAELMKPLSIFEIDFLKGPAGMPPKVAHLAPVARADGSFHVEATDAGHYAEALAALADSGATILGTSGKRQSLEEYFINLVRARLDNEATATGHAATGMGR
jgi:ABC-2 type transport system ATP-binding protein